MITGLKQKLDYSDYARIPPDGRRYELLEGDLYVTPAPSPRHQRVSRRLQRQLEAYFHARDLGEVFNAPIDLILTPQDGGRSLCAGGSGRGRGVPVPSGLARLHPLAR